MAATVLLPTPPLPEPTAMTLLAARPTSPIFSAGRWCTASATSTSDEAGKRSSQLLGQRGLRLFPQRGAIGGQGQGQRDLVAVELQVADLAHLHDAAAGFRVLELSEHLLDVRFGHLAFGHRSFSVVGYRLGACVGLRLGCEAASGFLARPSSFAQGSSAQTCSASVRCGLGACSRWRRATRANGARPAGRRGEVHGAGLAQQPLGRRPGGGLPRRPPAASGYCRPLWASRSSSAVEVGPARLHDHEA